MTEVLRDYYPLEGQRLFKKVGASLPWVPPRFGACAFFACCEPGRDGFITASFPQ